MEHFLTIRNLLTDDFTELRRLGTKQETPMNLYLRAWKEFQLGQHCYLAEEMLVPEQLQMVRNYFRLSEDQWQEFKRRFLLYAAR